MNLQETIQQIHQLVAEGKLKEAAQRLLQAMGGETDKQQFHLYNQAISQLSRLNELESAELSGTISSADAELIRNQIRTALLEIAGKWQAQEPEKLRTPSSMPAPTVAERPGVKGWKIALSFLAAILIGYLIWNAFVKGSNGPPLEGCYIKTSLMTSLVMDPSIESPKIGTLPKYEYYQVLATEAYQHVSPIYFFKIYDKKLGVGWVQDSPLLEEISPECLRNVDQIDPRPSGCYITSGLATPLLSEASVFAAQRATLPNKKHYPVLDTKMYRHGNEEIRFFWVEDENLGGGWVQHGIGLDFVSGDCD